MAEGDYFWIADKPGAIGRGPHLPMYSLVLEVLRMARTGTKQSIMSMKQRNPNLR